jgi:hypothetical protein
MNTYTIQYNVATYSGQMTVTAKSTYYAIEKVKALARKALMLPMFSESYKVVSTVYNDDYDDYYQDY